MGRLPILQDHPLSQRFVDLFLDDAFETSVDLSTAVGFERPIPTRDVVPQKEEIEHDGGSQAKNREDPDYQREQHTEQDNGLHVILLCQGFHVDEELYHGGRAIGRCVLTLWDQIQSHDRVQSDGVDHLSWTLCEDHSCPCYTRLVRQSEESRGDSVQSRGEALLTFKREVREQSNVLGAFLTLGQLGEDQEPLPAPATRSDPDTLEADGQGVQVALCDAVRSNHPNGADPSVDQEDERNDDADGEHQSRYRKWDRWFDLASPSGEDEQVDCGEGVHRVDRDGDEQKHIQEEVGDGSQAGRRLEVIEVLRMQRQQCSCMQRKKRWRLTM